MTQKKIVTVELCGGPLDGARIELPDNIHLYYKTKDCGVWHVYKFNQYRKPQKGVSAFFEYLGVSQ